VRVRLFYALELDGALRTALDHALAPLRVVEPDLAWVHADKLHLTMKFLGDVDERDVERLTAAADGVANGHRPFEMTIGGVGAFPNFRRGRVVWVGVESDPRLELFHHDLEVACAEAGFEVEGRPFRPHITVARMRSALPIERARLFARAARRVAYAASEPVRALSLLESTMASGGSRYRCVHAASLGGG
jgi:2'-5' RNA ligase